MTIFKLMLGGFLALMLYKYPPVREWVDRVWPTSPPLEVFPNPGGLLGKDPAEELLEGGPEASIPKTPEDEAPPEDATPLYEGDALAEETAPSQEDLELKQWEALLKSIRQARRQE